MKSLKKSWLLVNLLDVGVARSQSNEFVQRSPLRGQTFFSISLSFHRCSSRQPLLPSPCLSVRPSLSGCSTCPKFTLSFSIPSKTSRRGREASRSESIFVFLSLSLLPSCCVASQLLCCCVAGCCPGCNIVSKIYKWQTEWRDKDWTWQIAVMLQ